MADTVNSAAAPRPSTGTGANPDPLIGRVINDRFRIISLIARGGMGKVYKAEQSPLGRICAVKVLNANYAGDNDPEFHKRFFLEASIASKLSHPNTVTIFDYGRTDDDVYFMAMEFLEGRTLHRLIREEAPLDPHRMIHIVRQVCRSLREAHGLGVIHRDLKPANIFLIQHDEETDFVKVLDFGLVKNVDDTSENLTQTGLFMGSPKYMAPEQIRGEKVTAATDVYSLGVVMYEMLTGKVPFDRGNSVNTLMAHVSDPVPLIHETAPSVSISPAIEEVVYKCLEKRADERFTTMDEMLVGLKRAAGESISPTGEYSGAGFPRISSPDLRPSIPGQRGEVSGAQQLQARSGLARASSGAPAASGQLSHPPPLPSATPAPTEALLFPDAAPRKSRSWLYLAAGLICAAGGAYGLHRGGYITVPHSGHESPVSMATHTSPATATPIPSPPAPTVHVALDSDPPNAEVREGDTVLGHTPLRLDWTGDQGDPSRSHSFTFHLANYQDATATLTGASLEHNAHLDRVPARPASPPAVASRPRPRPAARPAPRPSQPAQRPPPGYRSIDDW